MPIEIRELVIKATILQDEGSTTSAATNNNSIGTNEEIIHICVDKILEILKEKNER